MVILRARPILIACLALFVFGVPSAQAYKLGGTKWPTRTITYNASKAPKYAEAIKQAVNAWNTSGVNVRFRATSRGRARVSIFQTKSGPNVAGGYATLGWESPSTVTNRSIGGVPVEGYPVPCGLRIRGKGRVVCRRGPFVQLYGFDDRKDPSTANAMAMTVAHELGHILGLNHVRSKCALMNPHGNQECKPILQPWRLRCRLLEADDVRGAIRRYGGRMRPLAPEFCDATPEPAAPTELAATFDSAERVVRVSWTNPATTGIVSAEAVLRSGGCPPSFDGAYGVEVKPGQRSAEQLYPGEASGLHCVAVRSKDSYQHVGPPAMTEVQVVPPSETPPELEP